MCLARTGLVLSWGRWNFRCNRVSPDNKEEGEASAPLQLPGQSTVRVGGREERAGKAQVLPTSGTLLFFPPCCLCSLLLAASLKCPEILPSFCAGFAWASLAALPLEGSGDELAAHSIRRCCVRTRGCFWVRDGFTLVLTAAFALAGRPWQSRPVVRGGARCGTSRSRGR